NGSNSFTVIETNPAGTPSATSPATAVVVDTTTPAAPATPTLTDDSNASIPAGASSSDGHPHISGTGVSGDIIKIYDGATMIGSTKVDGTGKWTFTPATDLSIGAHSITATQTNAAGTTSAMSGAATYTFAQTVAPPVITVLGEWSVSAGAEAAKVPSGSTTPYAANNVYGTGIAGDTVKLYDGATLVGSATVATDGSWWWGTLTWATGAHTLTATQTSSAGVTSAVSNTFTFTVNTSTPATPAAPTLTDDANASIPAGSTTADGHPHISGTGTAGDKITVYDGSTVLGTATVDTNGKWTFTPATDLAAGTHSINVTETNAAGTASAHSANTSFTFSTAPTETVTITNLVDDSSGSNVNIAKGGSTKDTSPIVQGTVNHTLLSGETLVVYRDGVKVGNATMSGTNWSYNDSAVAVGTHTYTARVENSAGQSAYSAGYSFTEAAQSYTGHGGTIHVTPVDASDSIAAFDFTGLIMPAGSLFVNAMGLSGNWLATSIYTPGGSNVVLKLPLAKGSGDTSQGIFQVWFVPVGAPYVGGTGCIKLADTTNGVVDGWTASGAYVPFAGSIVTGTQNLMAVHETQSTHDAEQAAASTTDSQQTVSATDTDSQPVAAVEQTQDSQHIAIDATGVFHGVAAHGNETVDLNLDPASYFKQGTAHIEGAKGGAIDTLHLTGDHQVLDLTSLTGQTAAAKISGIEVIDLGGHANNLKLSLTDVLNLGEQDLFQKDGHQQLMVKGSNGDTVDLSNAHIAGVADGQWQAEGTAVVGGVTYNVYEHSGAHTELLVQQGVQIALHN
ncbi:Ig-like domain-containing protein, partial [Caballeronia sp. dw_19]|uniref:Ig-like domain-containing protein n=1 Tax=Caballeronia sp. dw_19 TaxID=2719791 RepID=UPI002107ACDB